VLVTRRFLFVMAVTLLFFTYVGLQIPLIPRLIEEQLGGNEFDIGINIACFSIAAVAIRPWLGRWSERYGLRALMIGGALAASCAAAMVPLAGNMWALLPLRALAGAGEGSVFVGAATMVNDLAPAHRRAEATSYLSLSVFGGIGIGPVISEAVTTDTNFDRGFQLAACFTVLAALCALTLPGGPVQHDDIHLADDPTTPTPRFHRAALRPGAVLAFGMAGFATFNAFVPEHSKSVGLGGSKYVFLTYSVMCLVVRLVGARLPDRLGLARAGSIALTGLALGLTIIWGIATPAGLFAGTVVLSIGMSFLYPSLSTIAVNAVPAHERARVVATFTMFFEIGSAAGGLAFGLVGDLTGKRGAFLGGAISALVGLWVLWRVLIPWQRGRPISASETAAIPAH
jgi:MFS family permease